MRVSWLKAIGLAGVVGVAATGIVVARAHRQRLNYTPDEVRARLHARLAEEDERSTRSAQEVGTDGSTRRHRLPRIRQVAETYPRAVRDGLVRPVRAVRRRFSRSRP